MRVGWYGSIIVATGRQSNPILDDNDDNYAALRTIIIVIIIIPEYVSIFVLYAE